jgi:hypothetical protein
MKACAAHRTNPTQTVLPHDESLGNESQKIESIWTYRSVADQKYTFTLRLTQQTFQTTLARYRPTRKKSTSDDMRSGNRGHLARASDLLRGESSINRGAYRWQVMRIEGTFTRLVKCS